MRARKEAPAGGNESKLLLYHQRLTDTMEDQLSLAAIHFLRSHFQEVGLGGCGGCFCVLTPRYLGVCVPSVNLLPAHDSYYMHAAARQATEIYKRLLLENRGELALNVYVAMCYYKMDYYDVALEILAVYLQVRCFAFFCVV